MGAALVMLVPSAARAACPQPALSAKPTSGMAGSTVLLTGQAFYSACPGGV